MRNQSMVRNIVLVIAAFVVLGLLRFKPWQRVERPSAGRESLQVGFLPVT